MRYPWNEEIVCVYTEMNVTSRDSLVEELLDEQDVLHVLRDVDGEWIDNGIQPICEFVLFKPSWVP